ncbi:hypothetical protein M408DRAFT_331109 [Serendipita vermifera MAFF 305830]|uniref:Uncharacterized protein n=1 Tax=Serendipita vermifera MAFF 305830 TaxID=933852 RepID=A0A0C2WGM7_SERVB|nr:hypothetical protein M408DRAFT_331109 [Serendipita vermifera MAFF 305830]
MDPTLPSLRELELEQLLREREQQLSDITSELVILRKQLSESPSHGQSDELPVSAAAMAVLMPHLVNERNALVGTGSSSAPPNPALVAALRQRATMLQEENDELYNVLRRAETGRLDEEVKGLRVLVGRLERALRESNSKAKYFAEEMEKTTEILARKTSRSTSRMDDPISTPPYPAKNNRHPSPHNSTVSNSVSKPAQPPTGPRHKKPRTHASPVPQPISAPNNTRHDSNSTIRQENFHEKGRQAQRERERERDRGGHGTEQRPERGGDRDWDRKTQVSAQQQQNRNTPMEVDRRERERERDRDRDRDRERDHGSSRERASASERARTDGETNGGLQIRGSARHRGAGGDGPTSQGQGRGRSPRRGPAATQSGNGRANGLPNRPDNGYRGLAERMGL